MLNNTHPEWQKLDRHAKDTATVQIRDLFLLDPDRYDNFHLGAGALHIDYSRQNVTRETMDFLLGLARACRVEHWRDDMFKGAAINTTENRPVLHTALRRPAGDDVRVNGENIMPGIHDTFERMRSFTHAVHSGAWTGHSGKRIDTIINIGIGGSDLGPRMVVDALRPYHVRGMTIHFVANVDGADLHNALSVSNPETTLFLAASKTFTTQETMKNAQTARAWLVAHFGDEGCVHRHFAAMSTNAQAVRDFGINTDVMFPFGEWVGGRYSLWSAIGLSICMAVGFDHFRALLNGGHDMDAHFRTAPMERNAPIILALLGVWQRNFQNRDSHAVLPYDQNLARFPAWLQQTDMESNGKRVARDGSALPYATGPVIFGDSGTNAQHAFFQLLHQGTDIIPCDFIGALESHAPYPDHHCLLLANMVAQADALMHGREQAESGGDPARTFPGNRPSTVILMDKTTPRTLGQLIALYEHKVFVQGIVWGINSFDQFGVELGKVLANDILKTLENQDPALRITGILGLVRDRLKQA